MKDRERLIQEEYVGTEHGPWKVLVICQCLNRSAWPVAEIIVKEIFERYPDPYSMDEISLESIEDTVLYEIVKSIGLGRQRVENLIKMSRQYTACIKYKKDQYHFYDVRNFRGCGQYAADAWRLFVLKMPCMPLDKHLRRYAEKEKLLYEG